MTQVSSLKRAARSLQKIPWALSAIRKIWRYTRPRYTAGSVAVVFNDAGEVLIVEHVFHAYQPWGLPGGYLNRRENPDGALARELREELQLEVDVRQIVLVERNFGDHLDLAYLCHARSSIGKLSPELVDYRWVEPSALPDLRPFHRRAIENAAQFYHPSESKVWMA